MSIEENLNLKDMERQFCGFNLRLNIGKRKRLNKFISKWIKSDLPEDRSSVLLLGVTRIPTSPVPARRPCSLPLLDPINNIESNNTSASSLAHVRRTSFSTRRQIVRRNSSVKKQRATVEKTDETQSSSSADLNLINVKCTENNPDDDSISTTTIINNTSANNCSSTVCNESTSATVMDRSVDSIGTCSLDVEASADLSDWSEASSGGTLRSAVYTSSIKTPSSEPHLPSYLSLACTVNGYSTTTNYDPIRLSRSRDASPHRYIEHDNLTPKNTPSSTYSIQNNLLSPPNLVPLPTIKQKMNEHSFAHQQHLHQEFYRTSTKTMTFKSEAHHFNSSGLFGGKDTIDACYENGNRIKSHSSYESKKNYANGTSKTETTTSTAIKEFSSSSSSSTESKSFIQQRVERLYGPGALAQGFFVTTKKQKNRESESENESSFGENSIKESNGCESPMKQSASSPALPVLRHLTPEFRAQLPMISPRKSGEQSSSMQKSSTLPTLKDEIKLNGHAKNVEIVADTQSVIAEESGEKDGHYFLKILQNETGRLLKLADKVEVELNDESLSEEVVGVIRSAAGKARLLVSQKMQQFKGLCTCNITQSDSEAFPTTNEDLQGFWDMVMLQVDQVDALFKDIDEMKANNWQEVKVETVSKSSLNGKGASKRVVVKAKPTAASEEARKKREAQRKQMIEERRKAMKAQQNKPVESIEIFVPESS